MIGDCPTWHLKAGSPSPARVRAVTYHGATTRYAVALDGGGELTVMQQNAGDGGRGCASQVTPSAGLAAPPQPAALASDS